MCWEDVQIDRAKQTRKTVLTIGTTAIFALPPNRRRVAIYGHNSSGGTIVLAYNQSATEVIDHILNNATYSLTLSESGIALLGEIWMENLTTSGSVTLYEVTLPRTFSEVEFLADSPRE